MDTNIIKSDSLVAIRSADTIDQTLHPQRIQQTYSQDMVTEVSRRDPGIAQIQ